jgi:hypothetical protein
VNEIFGPALHKVVDILDIKGYRYAIIGGIALSQWGIIRFTQDIDIKVLVPDVEYSTARKALMDAFPKSARAQLNNHPLIVAVEVDGITVDFLLTLPGYEVLIVERAVQRDFGGWLAWVCTAEDLIIQKVIAGRRKDWPDVEALLVEQRGKLDEAYIEDWLIQLAEALDEPDLLSEYQQLFNKIQKM